MTTGLNASHTWQVKGIGLGSEWRVGVQLQNDNIFNGLYSTAARQRISTTRQDHIVEQSVGVRLQNTTYWKPWFRTVAGLRADHVRFDVSSDDARGTTIRFDSKTNEAATPVPPLVRSRGAKVGVRPEIVPGLQSALSVYRLDFDSELVFLGDAGTTEAGRPSRRIGFEFSNYWRATRWLTLDADVAYAQVRFRRSDPAGDRIPGAVEGVASLALAVDRIGPYFGALQLRYFGPRPLIEDNSVRSHGTATLNGRIGP